MNLSTGAAFRAEAGALDIASWHKLLAEFDDASVYQSYSYGEAWHGQDSVSHLVLKQGESPVGACQVVVRRVPLVNTGAAYIVWGPLWRKKGSPANVDVYRALLRAVREEYGRRRKCLIRVWPCETGLLKDTVAPELASEGFAHIPDAVTYRTLRIDLSPSLEELRKNFVPRWRTSLNRSERNSLTVLEGTEDRFFEIFKGLSKECQEKKNFVSMLDVDLLRRAQVSLPEPMKLFFVVACHEDQPVCAAAYAIVGETAVYILGATGIKGYDVNAAYLVQWRVLQRLKALGARYYDLGGVDPDGNAGVYRFKAGLAGKNGIDETFLGEFHGAYHPRAKLAKIALKLAQNYRKMRNKHHAKTAASSTSDTGGENSEGN